MTEIYCVVKPNSATEHWSLFTLMQPTYIIIKSMQSKAYMNLAVCLVYARPEVVVPSSIVFCIRCCQIYRYLALA